MATPGCRCQLGHYSNPSACAQVTNPNPYIDVTCALAVRCYLGLADRRRCASVSAIVREEEGHGHFTRPKAEHDAPRLHQLDVARFTRPPGSRARYLA